MNSDQNVKFDFNDILIEPAGITNISSRSQINPFKRPPYAATKYDDIEMLPIFTAPMDTVVSKDNFKLFIDNKINVCQVRTNKVETHSSFCNFFSLSLDDFIKEFVEKTIFRSPGISAVDDGPGPYYRDFVLIDIANGHMQKMMDAIRQAKEKHGDRLYIMAGNVANPITYLELANAGADAVRIGIGNGNGCFLDGTKVFTKRGFINIEDVNIGDFVLTHLKNYKEVIAKTRYASNEQMYDINGVKCTDVHEFYVVLKTDKNKITEENYTDFAFWIEAKNLDDNIHLILEIDENA